jgi:hypothetical protein
VETVEVVDILVETVEVVDILVETVEVVGILVETVEVVDILVETVEAEVDILLAGILIMDIQVIVQLPTTMHLHQNQ